MTKEALKDYLTEAVNAVGEEEVGVLFPTSKEPGLYAVMQELIGLKGAVSKLSGANLKLNQEVNDLVKTVASQKDENTEFPEEAKRKISSLETALKGTLVRLMDMDELMQLTVDSFADLPKLTETNTASYQRSLNSWKKGYDLTIERWQKTLQANDLKKVGLVGEIFDPKLHQAVGVKHWNNIANNIILETEQAGFLHRGKVSRLAKVVVNKLKVTSKTEEKPMKEVQKTVAPKTDNKPTRVASKTENRPTRATSKAENRPARVASKAENRSARVASRTDNKPARVAQNANRNGRVAVVKKAEIEEWGQASATETATEFGQTKRVDKSKEQESKKDKKKETRKKEAARKKEKAARKKKKEKAASKKRKKENKLAKKQQKQEAKQQKKKRNKKQQKKKSKKNALVTSGKVTIQKIEKDSNYLIIVRE